MRVARTCEANTILVDVCPTAHSLGSQVSQGSVEQRKKSAGRQGSASRFVCTQG